MTVATENYRALLRWTGVEASFTPGFSASSGNDVTVGWLGDASTAVVPLAKDLHFGVTLAPGSHAVTVTPIAMPAPPGMLIVERVTPATQETDFRNLQKFSADIHTTLHDRAAMRAAEIRGAVSRMVAVSSGSAFAWSSATSASDPGSGCVKANSATFGSITRLYISELDAETNLLAAEIGAWASSSSQVKGVLRLYDPLMPRRFMSFEVSHVSDAGAWQELTVTPLSAGAAFVNGLALRIDYRRSGDAGTSFTFLDAWNNATFYGRGNSVRFGGAVYIAKADNINVTPGTNPAIWGLAIDGVAGVASLDGSVGSLSAAFLIVRSGILRPAFPIEPQQKLSFVNGSPNMSSNISGAGAEVVYWQPDGSGLVPAWISGTHWEVAKPGVVSYGLTQTLSGTLTNGNATVSLANVRSLIPGMKVTGTGIQAATTIASINTGANTIQLSATATTGGAQNLTFKMPAGTLLDLVYDTVAGDILAGAWGGGNLVPPFATTLVDGITVMAAAAQRIFIGAVFVAADGQGAWTPNPAAAAGGNAPMLGLYNQYRQVMVAANCIDSAASWSVGASQQLHASNNNRINFIVGRGTMAFQGRLQARVTAINSGNAASIGMAIDNTSAIGSGVGFVGAADATARVDWDAFVSGGFHYLQAMETLEAGAATIVGGAYMRFSMSAWM